MRKSGASAKGTRLHLNARASRETLARLTPMSGGGAHEAPPAPGTDRSGAPAQRARRSEAHEAEIAKLLADVKLRASTPRAASFPVRAASQSVPSRPAHLRRADGENLRTATWSESVPRPTRRVMLDAEVASASSEDLLSPSLAASERRLSMRRAMAAQEQASDLSISSSPRLDEEPDLTPMSYLRSNTSARTRRWRRLSDYAAPGRQALRGSRAPSYQYQSPPASTRTPQSLQRKHAAADSRPSTPSVLHASQPFETDSVHVRNLEHALDLFRLQCSVDETDAGLQHSTEAAVELARAMNAGLHNAIHRSLEVRMSLALKRENSYEDKLLDGLDADMSELLKYSDDHIRRLTDTLIQLTRVRGSDASPRKGAQRGAEPSPSRGAGRRAGPREPQADEWHRRLFATSAQPNTPALPTWTARGSSGDRSHQDPVESASSATPTD